MRLQSNWPTMLIQHTVSFSPFKRREGSCGRKLKCWTLKKYFLAGKVLSLWENNFAEKRWKYLLRRKIFCSFVERGISPGQQDNWGQMPSGNITLSPFANFRNFSAKFKYLYKADSPLSNQLELKCIYIWVSIIYSNSIQAIRLADCTKSPLKIAYRPVSETWRLVHNGGFPKFEALYCSLNMVSSWCSKSLFSYEFDFEWQPISMENRKGLFADLEQRH